MKPFAVYQGAVLSPRSPEKRAENESERAQSPTRRDLRIEMGEQIRSGSRKATGAKPRERWPKKTEAPAG